MNKALKIGGVILLCGATCAGGFFAGQYLNKSAVESTTNLDSEKTETATEEELDINSPLVKLLYKEVSVEDSDNWLYRDYVSQGEEDFYASKAPEKIKLQLIGNILNNQKGDLITTNICSKAQLKIGNYTRKCEYSNYESMYTKDFVESIYKLVYGKDANLDTTIDINVDAMDSSIYHYDNDLQVYLPYQTGGLGGTASHNYEYQILKATKTGNQIKITEHSKITQYSDMSVTEANYTYTFEADDGYYKFVSRVKEK